jgi:type IV pilus assembly protein PilV
MKQRSNPQGRGFSLVEVMVALIVICVGMLGIAKMQALVLSSTGGSRMRALAALEASSLATTMHADRDYWSGSPAATTTVADTGGSASVTTSDSALQTAIGNEPSCLSGGAAPCSHVNMAAYDLDNWSGDMLTTLPGSTSTIACATSNGVESCTLTITWQENTVASNSQESSTAFQNQTYQLVVEP